MKLVELLATEMGTWPEDATHLTQSMVDSEVYNSVGDVCCSLTPRLDLSKRHTQDIGYPEVTKAQWQAERDRQKGGEWKRHRGGAQPVDNDVYVEVHLRCGDIQQSHAQDFIWPHKECDRDANLTKYRVISHPQAEEVEYRGPFPCAPAGTTFNEIELDIHYPSGVCSMESKTDQMETPFKWRDEVTELNAYIEKYTRERDALIERLASEGFALIPPVVSVVSEFSGAGMILPIDEWQIGDIVEVVSVSDESSAPLGVFKITDIDAPEPKYELDDQYFPNHNQMKFIRRP